MKLKWDARWLRLLLPLVLLVSAPIKAEETSSGTATPTAVTEPPAAAATPTAVTEPPAAASSPTALIEPPAPAAQAETHKQVERSWSFNLYADEQYRLRIAPDPSEKDNDLRLFLDTGLTDPGDRFSLALAGGFYWDLDGAAEDDNVSSFYTYRDSKEPPIWGEVYKLYGEYHSPGWLRLARAGRQVAEYGLPATFDGAALTLSPVAPYFDLFLFGGRTQHFFEMNADLFEDYIASAGAVIRPFSDMRLELDYRFLQEDLHGGGEDSETTTEATDQTATLAALYRLQDIWYLKVFGGTLDNSFARVGGSSSLNFSEIELGCSVKAQAQVEKFGELTEEGNPYFSILGESLPFMNYGADIWKAFTTKPGTYALHLGFDGRHLLRAYEEDPFNRNFGRAYLLFTASDIFVNGPFLTLMGERWGEEFALDANGLWAAGGSAGYENNLLRAEAGTYYQRYKYQYYQVVEEISDVRTFFADFRIKPLSWFAVKARGEAEFFDREIYTFTLGLAQMY
jgi:hypothetical protein